MKKIIFSAAAIMFLCLFPAQARPAKKTVAPVIVRFQVKQNSNSNWSTGSTTLHNATTESMMLNQISSRYPNCKVRILAARRGTMQAYDVRYQVSRDKKNWSTSSAVLYDAPTQSMAKNQIAQRYPGMFVRILSKNRK